MVCKVTSVYDFEVSKPVCSIQKSDLGQGGGDLSVAAIRFVFADGSR